MKKVSYLLLVLILALASCSENEDQPYSVHIQLLPPDGYTALPYEEMEVTLTNKNQGTVYSLHCSSTGQASLDVEPGYYSASVHHQTNAGLIFSGRIESLALLPDQEETCLLYTSDAADE